MSPLLTLDLAGSERERGRQHGERLRDVIASSGVLPYYRDYCLRFLPPNGAVRTAASLAQAWLARGRSPALEELAAGFAEGAAIPAADVRRSLIMPDLINTLAGLAGRAKGPALGCTSVAAWGEATREGRFLYGRNLDFCGVGLWDRHPLVSRHRPRSGIPYVSVSSAGCIADGVTGINAEGLTVSLHQHYTTDVSLLSRTRPILDLAAETLRTARNIEEAAQLCARARTSSGWTVVLTHWKERKACALERSAGRWAARVSEGPVFVHTNGYADAVLRAREFHHPALRASSDARAARAGEIARRQQGRLDAAGLALLLSDHVDPERDVERLFAQAIAQPNTLVSVVFEPEQGCAWVAEGRAPVSMGSYRRVALWEEGGPSEESFDLSGAVSPARLSAARAYVDAYALWEAAGSEEAVAAKLDAAVASEPDEPYSRLMRGLSRLRLGLAAEAAEDFAAGAALPDISHRRRLNRLWLARALDVQGRRSQALPEYAAAAAGARDAVAAAAGSGASRPYAASRARSALPDFNLGDTYTL